jgi:hypothetical protein
MILSQMGAKLIDNWENIPRLFPKAPFQRGLRCLRTFSLSISKQAGYFLFLFIYSVQFWWCWLALRHLNELMPPWYRRPSLMRWPATSGVFRRIRQG